MQGSRFLRYIVIFVFGTMLIIFSSIFLRHICVKSLRLNCDYLATLISQNDAKNSKITQKNTVFLENNDVFLKKIKNLPLVKAQENSPYILIESTTPLYQQSDLNESSIIMLLPTGYYADAIQISHEQNLAKVSYNGVVGFIELTCATEVSSITGAKTQKPEATTKTDAGTHLRKTPNTTLAPLSLIPAGSTLSFLGYITGETPTDGLSNIWYLVTYDVGPTTTHYGYIYSERVNLSFPLETKKPEDSTSTNISSANTSTDPTSSMAETLTGKINLSSTVKWFLIILFSVLAVIIFLLLLVSPKKPQTNKTSKNNTSATADPPQDATTPKTKIATVLPNQNDASCQNINKPSRLNEPTQKKWKKFPKKPAKKKPLGTHNYDKYMIDAKSSTETAIFGYSENKTDYPRILKPKSLSSSNPSALPPFVSRYFNVSPTTQDDDELL